MLFDAIVNEVVLYCFFIGNLYDLFFLWKI